MKYRYFTAAIFLAVIGSVAVGQENDLERLAYNNPGLVVDLGVGALCPLIGHHGTALRRRAHLSRRIQQPIRMLLLSVSRAGNRLDCPIKCTD